MKQVGGEIVSLVQGYLLVNPYNIVKAAWDYPSGWEMSGWEEQFEVLRQAFPGLCPDGLPEMAQSYLGQEALWRQTFVFSLNGQEVRLWDGLLVFVLPGKAAKKLGLGDLWPDVVKGRKGKGLWGKLCEEILFPQLTPKFPAFYNHRAGEMTSDRFLPMDPITPWLQELEGQVLGDFACRPFNFGRRMAGYAVLASRWSAETELAGIASPTWISGQGLLTNPKRLSDFGVLWLDCGGDQYRFEDDRDFQSAPCFYFSGVKLGFGTRDVSVASGAYGAGVLLR